MGSSYPQPSRRATCEPSFQTSVGNVQGKGPFFTLHTPLFYLINPFTPNQVSFIHSSIDNTEQLYACEFSILGTGNSFARVFLLSRIHCTELRRRLLNHPQFSL